MDIVTRVAQDTAGNVATNATIAVYIGDSPALATIYEDADGNVAKMNPFTAGIFGDFSFYAHDGLLRMEASKLDGLEVIELGIMYHRVISPESVMLRALNGADIADKPAFRAAIGAASADDLTAYIPSAEKGAAFGVATLDNNQQIEISQIPQAIFGASYQGLWDASAAEPPSIDPVKGQYWIVSVSGSFDLDGITDWEVGDWAIFNGATWDKVDNTDAVSAVNGQIGNVVLTYSDVDADQAGSAATAEANAGAYTDDEILEHSASVDPHGDRAYTDAAIGDHSAAVDPHGDRGYADDVMTSHVTDTDPHGDRAYADSAVADHVAAVDPHGDRAYADSAVADATSGKTEIIALTPIADPSTATAEDVANAVNAVIAALQA